MLSRWPIFHKLLLGVVLVCLMVAVLAFSGVNGLYAYRHLARSISRRAAEMPRSAELTQSVTELRTTFARIAPTTETTMPNMLKSDDPVVWRERFRQKITDVQLALQRYREQLDRNDESDFSIDDDSREWDAVFQIESSLARLEVLQRDQDWLLKNYGVMAWEEELDRIEHLAAELPSHLHQRMFTLLSDVRGQYRAWIYVTVISAGLTTVMLGMLVALFLGSILRPLRKLVDESRRITAGDLNHRIEIQTEDEVAELASAMNAMTDAFQKIRDNLNEQVKERTKEVVRSEQLASVGFLAAGVAHEINNPLASIALCAESLESRVVSILPEEETTPSEQPAGDMVVIRKYLKRIQDEAFRCKGITEKLLDFSRLTEVQRHATDLGGLVQDVIEMVQTLGQYRDKRLEFRCLATVIAPVNAQEIKQVTLNLLTNALDSLDPGGLVTVTLKRQGNQAELQVEDTGCGMTEEVQRHLFEPFFTRRRDGRGTGLGLSITYRIIQEHGGTIEVHSDGPGRGSRFRVTLPLAVPEKTTSSTREGITDEKRYNEKRRSSSLEGAVC